LGLLGGRLTDVWETARFVAREAGGDPGCLALAGSDTLPEPRKPLRLARQYTAGWQHTDDNSKRTFEAFLRALAMQGVEIVEPAMTPALLAYEEATTDVPAFFFDLMLWEMRWPMRALREAHPEAVSETVAGYIAAAERLTVDDHRRAYARREALRAQHRALQGEVDGFVTLAHIGPGQLGRPLVGTPWYNDASSAIGAPAFGLPMLRVFPSGLPLGVQLVGFEGEDEELAAIAHWLLRWSRPAGPYANTGMV
jgi:Asp-tRNA(Asn)/Glu-tRNA(Gln) amidotransferase A subunit family amidase